MLQLIKALKAVFFKSRQVILIITAFIMELVADFFESGRKIKKEMLASIMIHLLVFLGLGFMIYFKSRAPEKTYTFLNVKLTRKNRIVEKKTSIVKKKQVQKKKKKKKTRKKIYRKKKRRKRKKNTSVRKKKKVKRRNKVRKKLNPVRHVKKNIKKIQKKIRKKKKILVSKSISKKNRKKTRLRDLSITKKENLKPKIRKRRNFTKRILVDALDQKISPEKKHFSLAGKKVRPMNSIRIDDHNRIEKVQRKSRKKIDILAMSSGSERSLKKDNIIIQDKLEKKVGNITVKKEATAKKD